MSVANLTARPRPMVQGEAYEIDAVTPVVVNFDPPVTEICVIDVGSTGVVQVTLTMKGDVAGNQVFHVPTGGSRILTFEHRKVVSASLIRHSGLVSTVLVDGVAG